MRLVQICIVAPALVAQAPVPELKSLSWLQGRWTGAEAPERFEEHWSLQGQSLIGTTLIYRLEAPDRIRASLSKAKDGRISTRSYTFTRARSAEP